MLAAIVLGAVYLLATGTSANGTHVVREEPIAYNLRYEDPVREITPAPGEWLHLEGPDRESHGRRAARAPGLRG